MPISYLDGPRLRQAMLSACAGGQLVKNELNRINVFPVPDGDTGDEPRADAPLDLRRLSSLEEPRVDHVADAIAQSAVMGARGNCGMMLSHFLIGLSAGLQGHRSVTTVEFGLAFTEGASRLEAPWTTPVEGTILTVIRDSAAAAREGAVTDFAALMRVVQARAVESLARTPDLLPVLSRAKVVDAGAKGFVALIDGIVRLIDSGVAPEVPTSAEELPDTGPSPAAMADFPHERGSYRFCTEGLVEGPNLPSEDDVRAALREGAEELIVIRTEGVLKVHLHTDHPETAFSYLKTLGSLVTHKAEDMWAQHEAVQRMGEAGAGGVRRAVGILVDSASDLPEAIVKAHGVEVVPLTLAEGEVSYLDRFELTAEAFHERLASGGPLPTTSQPTPGSFVEAYRRAATESESLVAVLVGSKLSGTVSTAGAAAQLVPEVNVHIVDSGGASLLTGLLALKAAELAEAGLGAEDIVEELKRIRGQSNILFTVRQLDRLIASGRVTRFNGWLGGVLDLKPVLGMAWDGGVKAYGKARGAAKVQTLLLDKIEHEIPKNASRLRFGVTHVGAPELVPALVAAVKARFGDHEVITAPATPVISTHLGIGAYGIAYICE